MLFCVCQLFALWKLAAPTPITGTLAQNPAENSAPEMTPSYFRYPVSAESTILSRHAQAFQTRTSPLRNSLKSRLIQGVAPQPAHSNQPMLCMIYSDASQPLPAALAVLHAQPRSINQRRACAASAPAPPMLNHISQCTHAVPRRHTLHDTRNSSY